MSGSELGMDALPATAAGHRQIHLWGFMGSGKSTVAMALARRLVWNYLDLDILVARHAGKSVAQIFADDGESEFRKVERHALRQAVQKPRTVVALGGGTPMASSNRELGELHATSVWLQVGFDVCRDRVGADNRRPLFDDPEIARQLFDARQSVYASADLAVDATAESAVVAAAIEALVRGPGETLG